MAARGVGAGVVSSGTEEPVEAAGGPAGPQGSRRPGRLLPTVGVVVVFLAAVLGANLFGVRDSLLGTAVPPARPVASGRAADAPTSPSAGSTSLRSQPWWQTVVSRDGTAGSALVPFTVAAGALEWRLTWTCTAGHLLIPSPERAKPLVDAGCPAKGSAYATRTGAGTLRVEAGGPWQVQLDQHVDVPLVEPPLPAMGEPGAAAVAGGPLYGIDEVGTGTATLYRLPGGSYALRLEDVFVTANAGLELRLSPVAAPHSTRDYTSGPSAFVAPLDVTAGSLNVSVPADVDVTRYKSLVVWCPTVNSAYAGAPLRRS